LIGDIVATLEAGRQRVPDFSKWSYWRLLKEERRWGENDMNGIEVRAEIKRRRDEWKVWALWITAGGAVIAAIFTVLNYFHSR
jgi:hypothetical protein